ncbi:hypothetical protein BASA62_004466 [Batrachochytrium salamandrivorans]|nr:hypothetical protein BASA62_004466 [Batrachochytrium salamandrivorans]
MQFFHLVPFVVVASYAAALPQPAELSEKYLNNVNVNLASGLEARSYQPAFNSQKGSATLVSLKRRDDSDGSETRLDRRLAGNAGDLLTKYLRRASYVNAAVRNWVTNFVPDIRDAIKDGLGDAEYSEVGPDSIETSDKLTVDYRTSLTALLGATSNIVDDLGSVTENLQTIDRSFEKVPFISA